jgi:hypothetical protein
MAKPALLICDKCHQPRRELIDRGTPEHPYRICGTCLHREERRQNTKEMWGKERLLVPPQKG